MKIVYVIFVLGLVFSLTGCIGSYKCTKRIIRNKDYISDIANEYGFTEYETYDVQYGDVQNLYSFLDNTHGLEPDRDFKMIVSWEDNTVSIITMSVCTEYDTVFAQREFPTLLEIDTIIKGYLTNEAIELSNDDPIYEHLYTSPYQFIYSLQHENFIHPLMYKVGSYLEDDYTKELLIIEKEEGLFSLMSIYYGLDETVNTNQMFYNELGTFLLSDLGDDNIISLCDDKDCIEKSIETEIK